MAYYINGREFDGATVHTVRECAESAGDGDAHPLNEMHVDGDTDRCPECAGGESGQTLGAECSRCGRSHDDGECWDLIDDGVCPWCDEYEGEHVGQHASSAHPDAWSQYKDD